MTSGVGSFIHSFSSTSFLLKFYMRVQIASRWSSSPFLWSSLRGGMEIPCVYSHGLLPPFGAHFRYLASSCRSWALSWVILALLRSILSPSCSKMAPRWPNIAQHSANMSQHSSQEPPTRPPDSPICSQKAIVTLVLTLPLFLRRSRSRSEK